VLGITVAFSVCTGAIALRIATRRDLGAGLLRPRPGPATAGGRLRGTEGLAWRLQRIPLITWAVSLVLLGALLGALASSIGDFLNNPSAREIIRRLGGPHVLSDAFVAAELGFAALMATAYGIQSAHRAATEERAGHAEAVLAGSVPRARWFWSHLTPAFAGTVVLMLGVGLGAGTARAVSTGHAVEIPRIVGASLAHLPAIWVVVALAALAISRSARLTPVGWSLLAGCVVLGELGALIGLSHWIMDVSPFTHVPRLPGGTLQVLPLCVLAGIAAVTAAAATMNLRHRDVA
jgi:ABC-2 type transport system permease protein